MTALFFGIGFGLVVGLRSLAGYDPALDWLIIVTVAGLITAPLGFLAGLGAFDYWVYYALGYRRATRTTRAMEPAAGRTTSASTPTTR